MILCEIPEALEMLEGKTVISADHGDLLGDRGWPILVNLYGHAYIHHQEMLTMVRWLVVDHDNRRKITAEEPTKTQEFLDNTEGKNVSGTSDTSSDHRSMLRKISESA